MPEAPQNEYKQTVFSYRLMEYLRNAIQHNIIPLSIAFKRQFPNESANNKLIISVDVLLNINMILAEDKRDKDGFSKELQAKEIDSIDIKNNVREYISCYSKLMRLFRDECAMKYGIAEQFINEICEKYNPIALPKEREIQRIIEIFQIDDHEVIKILRTIYDSSIRNITYLRNKNGLFDILDKVQITI